MGLFATACFDLRNIGKVKNGQTDRTGAALAQSTVLGSRGVETIFKGTQEIANGAQKVANIASKTVNPLLCAGAAVRVIKDDDQYAAAIEEGAAMGAMMTSEKLFKTLVVNPLTQADYQAAGKMASGLTSKLSGFVSNLSKGQKTAVAIGADLALVGVSILSYDIGKKFGKHFSNREDAGQNINFQT